MNTCKCNYPWFLPTPTFSIQKSKYEQEHSPFPSYGSSSDGIQRKACWNLQEKTINWSINQWKSDRMKAFVMIMSMEMFAFIQTPSDLSEINEFDFQSFLAIEGLNLKEWNPTDWKLFDWVNIWLSDIISNPHKGLLDDWLC